jgi:hypothetical protein
MRAVSRKMVLSKKSGEPIMVKKIMLTVILLAAIIAFVFNSKELEENTVFTEQSYIFDYVTSLGILHEMDHVNTIQLNKFRGFAYGIQVNHHRNSFMVRYDVPAKGRPFTSFSGFLELCNDGQVYKYKLTHGYNFLPVRSYHTFKNYLVMGSQNEIGIFDLELKDFVLRIPTQSEVRHVTGVGHDVFVTVYPDNKNGGTLYNINLEELDGHIIYEIDEKIPDQLFYSKEQGLYGLYTTVGPSKKDKQKANLIVKFDEKTKRFNIVAKLQDYTSKFAIYQNKAYVIHGEVSGALPDSQFSIVDLSDNYVRTITIGPKLTPADIKIIKGNIHIVARQKINERWFNFLYIYNEDENKFEKIRLTEYNKAGFIDSIDYF